MLIACSFPFASKNDVPFSHAKYETLGEDGDGWAKALHLQESSVKKLERDADILKQMADIQKLQIL
jgi:hypothetical protein